MNRERLIINALITCESLNPYTAQTVTQTWLRGSSSLDKPLSRYPSKLKRNVTLADLIPDGSQSPEEIAIQEDTERRIKELTETSGLTQKEKEVFELWCFNHWHPSEIAKFLGFRQRQQVQNLITKSVKKIHRNPIFSEIFELETG